MLTDLEIEELLKSGQLNIYHFDKERLGPVSYDVFTRLEKEDEESFYLVSEEIFVLPRDVAGIVCLRSNSSKRSSPIVASYSQLVDPGYEGKLIFRVLKLKYPIGDLTNLFQILFFKVEGKVGVSYNERKKSTAMFRQGF